jgi:ribose transport system substrate-binding protein
VQYALIGKARSTYWSQVEHGARAAEKQLGLPVGSVVFYAPTQADSAAQIVAFENFVAQQVKGIAIAPSEPRALELSIQRARDAGVWVITFDTDAPDSQRLFFVGTPQPLIGREAANVLLAFLGDRSGKIALGSTLLDRAANERITTFKDTLKANKKVSVLDATHDRQDANLAMQTARMALTANKDLIGAFGVYGYNGLAWCRAVSEQARTEQLVVVGFDATNEAIECLKSGALDALITPRPYEQGLQSVLALDSLARKGVLTTMRDLGFDSRAPKSSWILNVGLDVITRDGKVGLSLLGYAGKLDGQGIAREWRP